MGEGNSAFRWYKWETSGKIYGVVEIEMDVMRILGVLEYY